MGCGAARAVAVSPASSKSNIKGGSGGAESERENGDNSFLDVAQNYEYLVNNCGSFKCPPGTVPIVCLDSDSIPVIESTLLLDEAHQTGVFLPVIAANITAKGRILCYGHVDMFNTTYFNSRDTGNIIYNSLIWLNDRKTIDTPIHFVSFPFETQTEIKKCFAPHGIHLVFEDFTPELANEKFVMIPTYFEIDDKEKSDMLNQIITTGGGIGIVYVPDKNTKNNFFPINNFLINFGLSYSSCSLSDDFGTSTTVKVYKTYDQSERYGFYSLVDQFDKFVNTKNRNLTYLDDLTTTIRYNVQMTSKKHIQLIDKLLKLCWQYLYDTDYRLENGMVCPFVNHSIAAVLIEELYSKITVDKIIAHLDVASTFPGLASPDTVFGDHSVSLKICEESLISTGFWISAGTVSTVEGKNIPKGARIQIGSHNCTLLGKPGPWKRWPIVTTSFPFDGSKIEIASPYGGIIYLSIADLSMRMPQNFLSINSDSTQDKNENEVNNNADKINSNNSSNNVMELSFSNVTYYPRVVRSDPSIYETTSKYKVPWGEFVSENVIFTMPSQIMAHIPNFEETFKYIEKVVSLTSNYMNYQIVRPYRIVFDIETADEYEYQQLQSQFHLFQQQIQFISQKNSMGLSGSSFNSTQAPPSLSSYLNIDTVYHNTNFNEYISNSIKNTKPITINILALDSSNNSSSSMIVARYPIVLLLEEINDIFFNENKKNPGWFKLIMLIAMVSFREGVFDDTTEIALSAFVASIIFTQLFDSYDPLEQPIIEMPTLFSELWHIHSQINKKIIPDLIKSSQNDNTQTYEVPQDRWIAFVTDLSNLAKLNFAPILKKVKPIPLNAVSTLENLKPAPQI